MKKLIIVFISIIFAGCGSPQSADDSVHPAYTVEKSLGLYVGYQKARLVTDDGRLHDPVYNLVTSVIQEGCYLAYEPDPRYAIFGNASTNHNTPYYVVLRRQYRDGVPIDKKGTVLIGIGTNTGSFVDNYPAYIPGDLYY